VVGQDLAISAVARAIRRARSGLKNPRRPTGSFMFLGPTGVGKTEVAKAVAEYLFHDESALIRFDMSEYMEVHAVAKMIGSPPGYVGHEEGGSLTKKLREQPYSVLLLDEIEKAHPDILNVLLQVLDDGRLTDAHGETVDCKNCIIIMTSNIGSRALASTRALGFHETEGAEARDQRDRRDLVMRELKRLLSPEFINRIDELVVFDALGDEELRAISGLLLERLNEQLEAHGVTVEAEDDVHDWLVQTACQDRSYGARPLRRAIQRHVEDPLSEEIIRAGGVGEEQVRARVSVADGKLEFRVERSKDEVGVPA
jgi:ATP-dependent Clp protease ATP-binding subunit ClpC